MVFWVLSILWQKRHEKVSESSNADKNGLGEYLALSFRHLSWGPFWRSRNFLDSIGPSISLCLIALAGDVGTQAC